MPDRIYEEIRVDVKFWIVVFVSHATPVLRFWANKRLGVLYHFVGDGLHLAEDQKLFYRSICGAILFHGMPVSEGEWSLTSHATIFQLYL